jgi:hypothetical protein
MPASLQSLRATLEPAAAVDLHGASLARAPEPATQLGIDASTAEASATPAKRSRRICMSMVEPAPSVVPRLMEPVTSSKKGSLPEARGKFSGDVDGLVTSHPFRGCGTRKSRKNSAAPFITG